MDDKCAFTMANGKNARYANGCCSVLGALFKRRTRRVTCRTTLSDRSTMNTNASTWTRATSDDEMHSNLKVNIGDDEFWFIWFCTQQWLESHLGLYLQTDKLIQDDSKIQGNKRYFENITLVHRLVDKQEQQILRIRVRTAPMRFIIRPFTPMSGCAAL